MMLQYEEYVPAKDNIDQVARILKGVGTHTSISVLRFLGACKAFVSQPPIIIVDEDALFIEESPQIKLIDYLRDYLPYSTVICLQSTCEDLLSYEKIVVLDKGEVIEQGEPLNLIKSSKSSLMEIIKDKDQALYQNLLAHVSPTNKLNPILLKSLDDTLRIGGIGWRKEGRKRRILNGTKFTGMLKR